MPRSEAEDQAERIIHGAQLARLESSCRSSKAFRIDNRRVLDEDACFLPVDDDGRAKARRSRARRGGSDQRRTESEKLVGLNDDGETSAALLVPARAASWRKVEDLPADHQPVGGGASSAICSWMTRISSRSSSSATSRRTSARIADLTRRRAAASRRAVRTASESVRPSARTTSSAAEAASSSRTWRERARAGS